MRKTCAIGSVLAAALVFGVAGASPAVAASKFLLGGSEITSTQIGVKVAPLAGAKFLLEDVGMLQVVDLLCSGSFTGSIEPGGTLVNFILFLMSNEEALAETVLGKGGYDIECEDAKKVCTAPVLLVALNLVWHMNVELETLLGGGERYVLHLLEEVEKEPEFYIDCNTMLGLVEDYCKGLTIAELTNEAGAGVLATFSENEELTPPLDCTVGGEKKGLLAGSFLITDSENNIELSVSE
jgi:hypothetical protein